VFYLLGYQQRERGNDDVSIAGLENEMEVLGNDAAIVQRQCSFHSEDDGVKELDCPREWVLRTVNEHAGILEVPLKGLGRESLRSWSSLGYVPLPTDSVWT
jgi:hypothetical protein